MGEGLIRATLATIETRSWDVGGVSLSGSSVVSLYGAMPHRMQMAKAVQDNPGGRRWDRALKVLKAAGLVEYKGGRWQRTEEAKP